MLYIEHVFTNTYVRLMGESQMWRTGRSLTQCAVRGGRARHDRWRRALVFGAVITVLLSMGLMAAAQSGSGADGRRPPGTAVVRVVPGDTLWSIAARHAPPGADLRQVGYEIRVLNRLENSAIAPGQELQVPAVRR